MKEKILINNCIIVDRSPWPLLDALANFCVMQDFFNIFFIKNILFNLQNKFNYLIYFYDNIIIIINLFKKLKINYNNIILFFMWMMILDNIYYFSNIKLLLGRIKLSDVISKKSNINIKRHYSSQLQFSNIAKMRGRKDVEKNCGENSLQVKDYDKIINHPKTINKLEFIKIKERENIYVKLKTEFVNGTTKNNDVLNHVIDNESKSKEIKKEVVRINENSYTGYVGMPKIVYKFEIIMKKNEKVEDMIEEDNYFYKIEKDKEIVVNKQVEEINNNKEEIIVIDLNTFKLGGNYKGEFTKYESYKDFIDKNKFID